jgi:hypothetical protein
MHRISVSKIERLVGRAFMSTNCGLEKEQSKLYALIILEAGSSSSI